MWERSGLGEWGIEGGRNVVILKLHLDLSYAHK